MRRAFPFILLLIFPLALRAQLLWEISGNGARNKSYLLATNRLVDIQFLDTIPNVFKCYGRCKRVITEFTIQDHEAIAALRQAALLPDSVILSNFYEPADYDFIDQSLQLTLGMGMDKLCRMKPSYLTELYRTELIKRWLNYDEERSMETFFANVAQANQTPVIGLDKLGETLYMLFDREPFHWQCEELIKIVRYPENEIRQERAIRGMYLMGRLNDITYQVEAPDNLSTISYSDYQVYAQRNAEWAKRLKPYLTEGKNFITLNAIYLGGEKGLIHTLRDAGYRVRPVNRGR